MAAGEELEFGGVVALRVKPENHIPRAPLGEGFDPLRARPQDRSIGRAHAAIGVGVRQKHLIVAQFFGIRDAETVTCCRVDDVAGGGTGLAVAQIKDPDRRVPCGQDRGQGGWRAGCKGDAQVTVRVGCGGGAWAKAGLPDLGEGREGFAQQGQIAGDQIAPDRAYGRLNKARLRPMGGRCFLPIVRLPHIALLNPRAVD